MSSGERLFRPDSKLLTSPFEKTDPIVVGVLVDVEEALALQRIKPRDTTDGAITEDIVGKAVNREPRKTAIGLDQAAHILRHFGVINF